MSILSVIKGKVEEAAETAKNVAIEGAKKAADGITTLSQLSPKQVEEVENRRQKYLEGQVEG